MTDFSSIQKYQDMYRNLYPKHVRDMLELQKRVKPLPTPFMKLLASSTYTKVRHSLMAHEKIASMLAMQESVRSATAFTNAFSALDRISKTYRSTTFIEHLAAISYNFETLLEETDEQPTIIIDESKKIQHIITDIYHKNQNIYTLAPREFEEMIAELLRNEGFEVQLTKQTRDNGFDILALRKLDRHSIPLKFLVECKRYKSTRPVDIDIIRSFKEVLDTEQANRGIIATTSYFTKPAQTKRKETPYLLDYRDKDDIMQWVAQYYQDRIAGHNS